MSNERMSQHAVARFLGVSHATVVRFRRLGRLHGEPEKPGLQKTRILYDSEEVRKFAAKYKKGTSPEGRRHFYDQPPNHAALTPGVHSSMYRGECAAKIAPLIREGKTILEICELTSIDPLLVREIEHELNTSFDERRRERERFKLEQQERWENRQHQNQMRQDEYRKWQERRDKKLIEAGFDPRYRYCAKCNEKVVPFAIHKCPDKPK